MTDEHRCAFKLRDDSVYVFHVIGDRTRLEGLGQAAGTMAAKAQGDGSVALIGEEAQKMVVPNPCCGASAVNEKQRNGMGFSDRPLVDNFEHVASTSVRYSAA